MLNTARLCRHFQCTYKFNFQWIIILHLCKEKCSEASPDCRKVCTDLFQVNIVRQLHVLGVNLEDLQSASCIWDADVHFPIKTTLRGDGGTRILKHIYTRPTL